MLYWKKLYCTLENGVNSEISYENAIVWNRFLSLSGQTLERWQGARSFNKENQHFKEHTSIYDYWIQKERVADFIFRKV